MTDRQSPSTEKMSVGSVAASKKPARSAPHEEGRNGAREAFLATDIKLLVEDELVTRTNPATKIGRDGDENQSQYEDQISWRKEPILLCR